MKSSKLVATLVGLSGAVLLAITAFANWKFGHSLALDREDALLQAVAGVAVDILGAVLAMLVVSLWRKGERLWSGATTAVLVGCFAYSLMGLVGFGASGRVEKVAAVAAQAKASREAAELQVTEAVRQRDSALSWMKSTYSQSADRSDKKMLVESVKEMATKPVEVTIAPVHVASGDAQATVIAGALGWKIQSAQTAMMLLLAVILKVGEFVCFGVASVFWHRSAGETALRSVPGIRPTRPTAPTRSTRAPTRATYDVHGNEVNQEVDVVSLSHLPTLEDKERAAREHYMAMPYSERVNLANIYLAARWGVHRTTVSRWRRAWDRHHADDGVPGMPLRVVEGGRAA